MKVKLIITNYVKFGNPWNIKIGDKVLLHYNSYLAIQFDKIGTISYINNTDFKIKENNKMYVWSKHRIKCNYSNYKFEVL